jgi:hypothetical protein
MPKPRDCLCSRRPRHDLARVQIAARIANRLCLRSFEMDMQPEASGCPSYLSACSAGISLNVQLCSPAAQASVPRRTNFTGESSGNMRP